MRHPTLTKLARTALPALLVAGLASGGYLAAQPTGNQDLPDVTASGGTEARLSPREIATESDRLLREMEAMHVRVLELQGMARTSKDVIKLNCVNEHLLAVKQLLNIGDGAKTDLTEALGTGDRDAQVHHYGQIKLAHERATAERDNAEGCIGEELIFLGKARVDVDGPAITDDPTDDEDVFTGMSPFDFERAAYATPFGRD